MAGTYTYYFFDVSSRSLLGVLPLKQVTFTRKLDLSGDLHAVIPMSDPDVQAIRPVAFTQTGRSAVFVDRDGVLLWGGLVWKTDYESVGQTMAIDCEDFSTFLARFPIATAKSYTAVDPLAVVQDLVTYSKSLAEGDIGIQVAAPASSGQSVTVSFNPWDMKSIYEALTDMAAVAPGFDWAMDVAWAGGAPVITLTLSYPRRGRAAPDTGVVFEYPGNVASYEWPEDGTEIAVTAYAVGAGQGDTMLLSSSSTPGMLDSGYPLLQRVFDHKDVTDAGTLGLYAAADARAHAGPAVLPVLHVRADRDPVLGSYLEGDDVRLRITDPRFPAVGTGPGLDAYYRIQEVQVSPQDDQAEAIQLTLGPAPA